MAKTYVFNIYCCCRIHHPERCGAGLRQKIDADLFNKPMELHGEIRILVAVNQRLNVHFSPIKKRLFCIRTAASVFGCPQNGREGMGLYPKSAARQESSGEKNAHQAGIIRTCDRTEKDSCRKLPGPGRQHQNGHQNRNQGLNRNWNQNYPIYKQKIPALTCGERHGQKEKFGGESGSRTYILFSSP
mgnify:CR=1 FL=1